MDRNGGAASVQGRVALGRGSGRRITRLGRRREIQPLSVLDELCCDVEGLSLPAKILVEAHERERLERLCRYVARPPLAAERLSLAPDGKVIHRLRRHWRIEPSGASSSGASTAYGGVGSGSASSPGSSRS